MAVILPNAATVKMALTRSKPDLRIHQRAQSVTCRGVLVGSITPAGHR